MFETWCFVERSSLGGFNLGMSKVKLEMYG